MLAERRLCFDDATTLPQNSGEVVSRLQLLLLLQGCIWGGAGDNQVKYFVHLVDKPAQQRVVTAALGVSECLSMTEVIRASLSDPIKNSPG